MTTKETIQGYFTCLEQKNGWESFLAEDMRFTSFTSPPKEVTGKAAYLEATKRFYATIVSLEVRDLVIDGDKACALTRYELRPPGGNAFRSDVAEIFAVKDGHIASFGIYFDSAPFPK
jgi:ketosteroid isomerase-like protein